MLERRGLKRMAVLLFTALLAAVSLSASISGLGERMFHYVLHAPFVKSVTFRFIDVSEEKNEISEIEIENAESTTLDTSLYRLQIVSNFPRSCDVMLTFPAFYNETSGAYLGYTLKVFNDLTHNTYTVAGTSAGSKTISLAGLYGPDIYNQGMDTEYLFNFGYSFDLSGASGGRYVSNVALEVTIND
ncbi:MAG: hypothetical protein IJ831_04750 [Spirochaetales bacterium]|nr:hypothetical protein [Spirochaetales bacterium]